MWSKLATAIAHDYRTHYRQYRLVHPGMARLLADMKSRVGFDSEWPNKDQRTAINTPRPYRCRSRHRFGSTVLRRGKDVPSCGYRYSVLEIKRKFRLRSDYGNSEHKCGDSR